MAAIKMCELNNEAADKRINEIAQEIVVHHGKMIRTPHGSETYFFEGHHLSIVLKTNLGRFTRLVLPGSGIKITCAGHLVFEKKSSGIVYFRPGVWEKVLHALRAQINNHESRFQSAQTLLQLAARARREAQEIAKWGVGKNV